MWGRPAGQPVLCRRWRTRFTNSQFALLNAYMSAALPQTVNNYAQTFQWFYDYSPPGHATRPRSRHGLPGEHHGSPTFRDPKYAPGLYD